VARDSAKAVESADLLAMVTTRACIRSARMLLESHTGRLSQSLFLPCSMLQQLIIQYQLAEQNGSHQLAGRTLDQMLAFATSTMMLKMPRYNDLSRNLNVRTTGASFVTEVLRVAFYKKAQWYIESAGEVRGDEKDSCILRALQCAGYAVAIPLADDTYNASWKVQCYPMMFDLYVFFNEMEPALVCAERCAVLSSIKKRRATMEDLQSEVSVEVGAKAPQIAKSSRAEYIKTHTDHLPEWYRSSAWYAKTGLRMRWAVKFGETEIEPCAKMLVRIARNRFSENGRILRRLRRQSPSDQRRRFTRRRNFDCPSANEAVLFSSYWTEAADRGRGRGRVGRLRTSCDSRPHESRNSHILRSGFLS
jgi:hypothetical protein